MKDTTGIVGIDVDPEARSSLKNICQEVLKAIQVVPDSAEYRKSVESTMNYRSAAYALARMLIPVLKVCTAQGTSLTCWGACRIKAVESEQTDVDIEATFGLQLEQLILQAKSELSLIPMMAGEPPSAQQQPLLMHGQLRALALLIVLHAQNGNHGRSQKGIR